MFECECGRTFENRGSCKTHRYYCEEADIEFPEKFYKFQCEICSKKLKSKFNYEQHLKKCKKLKSIENRIGKDNCFYGCGRKSQYKLKNSKLCCESSSNKCPAVREKNSEGLKEAYKEERKDCSHWDGKRGWLKNKSYEEVYGPARAAEIKQRLSDANKEWQNSLTEQQYEEFCKSVSEGLLNSDKNIGGVRPGQNKWRGSWYYNEYENQEVWLDSSWELAYVEYLDEIGVRWIRNTKKFDYKFKNRTYKYIPDFYLPDEDSYVEVKGIVREKDEFKWEYFPHELKILKQKQLKDLGVL